MHQRSSSTPPAGTDGVGGGVVLVGAPLGNVDDASTRLRTELAQADVIAAEDTRRLLRLVRDLDVMLTGRIVSYFEGNEERRTPELIDAALTGARVVLVTDAGMPGVSDPGYRLIRAALDAGVPVSVAPGPSAVTTALVLSGLPSDRFCFEGFLPRRSGERRARLAGLAQEQRTVVLFEAPHRLAAALADAVAAFGPQRPGAICREMTKTYEEVRRAPLAELARWAAESEVRGEITLVIAGAPVAVAERPDDERLAAEVAGEQHTIDVVEVPADSDTPAMRRKAAIAAVARRYGLPKREVYDAVVRHRNAPPA